MERQLEADGEMIAKEAESMAAGKPHNIDGLPRS